MKESLSCVVVGQGGGDSIRMQKKPGRPGLQQCSRSWAHGGGEAERPKEAADKRLWVHAKPTTTQLGRCRKTGCRAIVPPGPRTAEGQNTRDVRHPEAQNSPRKGGGPPPAGAKALFTFKASASAAAPSTPRGGLAGLGFYGLGFYGLGFYGLGF